MSDDGARWSRYVFIYFILILGFFYFYYNPLFTIKDCVATEHIETGSLKDRLRPQKCIEMGEIFTAKTNTKLNIKEYGSISLKPKTVIRFPGFVDGSLILDLFKGEIVIESITKEPFWIKTKGDIYSANKNDNGLVMSSVAPKNLEHEEASSSKKDLNNSKATINDNEFIIVPEDRSIIYFNKAKEFEITFFHTYQEVVTFEIASEATQFFINFTVYPHKKMSAKIPIPGQKTAYLWRVIDPSQKVLKTGVVSVQKFKADLIEEAFTKKDFSVIIME